MDGEITQFTTGGFAVKKVSSVAAASEEKEEDEEEDFVTPAPAPQKTVKKFSNIDKIKKELTED